MPDASKMIDFHGHHIPAKYRITAGDTQPSTQRARWDYLAQRLPDEDALLRHINEGQLAARVINIPANLLADAEGNLPSDTYRRMNDDLAELVSRHPGKLYGLASVDAYDGDLAAREVERTIRDLKLSGIFVDCARGELLLDNPQARPTLEVAAKYQIPVFAHPVAPQPLTRQMTPYGLVGTLFARGAVNSASLIALLESGALAQLPGLRIVITAHATGGLAMIAGLLSHSTQAPDTLALLSKHVFIDTTLLHPAVLKFAVDLLGSGNVLAGSDWPIAGENPLAPALNAIMREAGLDATQQEAVAFRNAEALLSRRQVA